MSVLSHNVENSVHSAIPRKTNILGAVIDPIKVLQGPAKKEVAYLQNYGDHVCPSTDGIESL